MGCTLVLWEVVGKGADGKSNWLVFESIKGKTYLLHNDYQICGLCILLNLEIF